MPENLYPMGPTYPELREYVADFGVLAICYAQLERHLIFFLNTIERLEPAGLQVSAAFKAARAKKGPRTLGRLIKQLKTLGIGEESAQLLEQVNRDRIAVVHEAARLMDELGHPNLGAIHAERVRIRECYTREHDASGRVQESLYELFAQYVKLSEELPGPPRPGLAEIRQGLDSFRAVLERLRLGVTQA
jgi:hypothetical protein